MLKFSVT